MNGRGKGLFRRMPRVTVLTETGKTVRRGCIQAIGQGKETAAVQPTPFGAVSVPLYRYIGDAEELLGGKETALYTNTAGFSVLHAKAVDGPAGFRYIEAVLEKRGTDDEGT